jgi:hypothetical protein
MMKKTRVRSLNVTRVVEYLSGRVEWKRALDASVVLTCGNHHDLTIFIVEHSWPICRSGQTRRSRNGFE